MTEHPQCRTAADRLNGRLVVAFSSLGHFFSHYFPVIFATAVVIGIAPAWQMPVGELIALSTFGVALYGIGAIPASWLGDRWSQVALMVLFFAGCGVAALLVSAGTGPLGLLFGLAILGLCGSIYHPVGIAWLVASAEKRGMALGINGVFGSIGLASAPMITEWLTDSAGWRAAFQVPAMVSIAIGVLLLIAWKTGRVQDAVRPQQDTASPDWWAMRRTIGIFFMAFVTGGMIYQTSSMVMPAMFADRVHATIAATGISGNQFVSAVYVVAGLANFFGGWLADRFEVRRVYVACWAFQVPALYGIAALFEVPLVSVTALSVFLSIAMLPAENVMLTQYTPQRYWARVFGVKFILAFGVSSLAVPVAGFVYDQTGAFALFFSALACLVALVTAALMFLPKPSEQSDGRVEEARVSVPAE